MADGVHHQPRDQGAVGVGADHRFIHDFFGGEDYLSCSKGCQTLLT